MCYKTKYLWITQSALKQHATTTGPKFIFTWWVLGRIIVAWTFWLSRIYQTKKIWRNMYYLFLACNKVYSVLNESVCIMYILKKITAINEEWGAWMDWFPSWKFCLIVMPAWPIFRRIHKWKHCIVTEEWEKVSFPKWWGIKMVK